MEINLDEKKWHSNNGEIFVKGHLFYDNYLYTGNELLEFVQKVTNEDELKELLNKVQGYFCFILKITNRYFVVSDRIRSYPIFWSLRNNKVLISDTPYKLINANTKLNPLSLKEIRSNTYVTGYDTLFESINQTQAGEYVCFQDETYTGKYQYITLLNPVEKIYDQTRLLTMMDDAYIKATERMIQYLNGRQAIIPLSGGLDSRLLVSLLCEKKYKNIVVFTYGSEEKYEVLTSKAIANYWGIKWVFVPYDNKNMMELYNSDKFNAMIKHCSVGISSPHLQDWYAMEYLKENGCVEQDAVVIPGHTISSVAELSPEYLSIKKIFSSEDIVNMTYSSNYVFNRMLGRNDMEELKDKITKNYNFQKKEYNKDEAFALLSNYGYKERQTKYTVNSVRMYEFLKLDWYLPFWDKEVIDVWSKIPQELSYHRKIYYQYINNKYTEMQNRIKVFGHDKEVKGDIEVKGMKSLFKKRFSKLYRVYSAIKRRNSYYMNLDGYTKNKDFYLSILKGRYSYVEMWCEKYILEEKRIINKIKRLSKG